MFFPKRMPSCGTRQELPSAKKARGGFSLVEVVLALGVIAIGVVALLGLLSISAGSSRSSDQATVIASISRQVLAEMRGMPFASLPVKTTLWPVEPTTTDRLPVEPGDPTPPPPTYIANLYFDNEGRRATAATEAFYRCRVKMMPDPKTMTFSTTATVIARTNLYRVMLEFSRTQGSQPAVLQTVRTAISRQ